MKSLTINKKICTRCNAKMWPKIDDETDEITYPKNCRACKSPYWLLDKTRFY